VVTDFDPGAVRAFLDTLHGDSPGLVHICSTGNWAGEAFDDLDAATDYAGQLDLGRPAGVYVRATTIAAAPTFGTRGSAADSVALPGLWADVDIAGPGHKAHGLPPDEQAARRIVTESALPDPTLWVHSGGGLYPWWLFDKPHVIDGDLDATTALSQCWQAELGAAAARLGWTYGTGVGDLARVLRLPGTVNRKADRERPCRVIAC
jgi:putative DNA primase/helicase